jgi:hypothetical protein
MVQSPIPALGRDFADTAHGAVNFRKFLPVAGASPPVPMTSPQEFAAEIGSRIGRQLSQ